MSFNYFALLGAENMMIEHVLVLIIAFCGCLFFERLCKTWPHKATVPLPDMAFILNANNRHEKVLGDIVDTIKIMQQMLHSFQMANLQSQQKIRELETYLMLNTPHQH